MKVWVVLLVDCLECFGDDADHKVWCFYEEMLARRCEEKVRADNKAALDCNQRQLVLKERWMETEAAQ